VGLVGIEIVLEVIHIIKRSDPRISNWHIRLWVAPRDDEIHIVMILLLFLKLIVVVVHFYKGYFKLIINKAFNSNF